jgi:hypothetical protein
MFYPREEIRRDEGGTIFYFFGLSGFAVKFESIFFKYIF